MPVINSWADWLAAPKQWLGWPVRNIFNRKAEADARTADAKTPEISPHFVKYARQAEAEFRADVEAYKHRKARCPQLCSDDETPEEHVWRRWHTAPTPFLFRAIQRHNAKAIKQLETTQRREPVEIKMYDRGKIKRLTIPAIPDGPPMSAEQAADLLDLYVRTQPSEPVSAGQPFELRLTQPLP